MSSAPELALTLTYWLLHTGELRLMVLGASVWGQLALPELLITFPAGTWK